MSAAVVVISTALLSACGGGQGEHAELKGQVNLNQTAAPKVSFHAASRFLEQASMGPTPESVAKVQQSGLAGWIDWQMTLPASTINSPTYAIDYDLNDQLASSRARNFQQRAVYNVFIGGDDQLRLRVSWALSNFLVVSAVKIQPYGASEYFNQVLQRHAFGSFADLLKDMTRSPAMGFFLDNNTNTRWNLNENYGRELMQLFSVGLVQLNLDGTPKRNSAGKPLETYGQQDVVEATRALTGWQFAPGGISPGANWANYGKPMVEWPDAHDTGPKTVLGKTIPAGLSAAGDLDSLVKILVEHPNTAPFVSLRLIQNLTTSDPSPAYLQRVATVFQQSKGNLGQVVRAILLDPEARAGDVPGTLARGFGRIREPFALHVAIQRALGCQLALMTSWDSTAVYGTGSDPFMSPTVFNFHAPDHRAPVSLLLAPEQKLLNSMEFSRRLGAYNWLFYSTPSRLSDAGCDTETYLQALKVSDERLLDLLGQRMFRGAMAPAVRAGLRSALASHWMRNNPMQLLGGYIELAQATPAFGVSK